MSEYTFQMGEGSRAYAAGMQNFNYYGEEFVQVRRLTHADLTAIADGRFVTPVSEWHLAADRLRANSVLVMLGEPGTGRRTAALRLLSRFCGSDQLTELEPIWKQPRIELFPPTTPGHGYLLDMSELPAAPRHDDFGGQLLDWARRNSVHLVVTATTEAWVGRWTIGASDAEVRLCSPDARALVESELRTRGADDKAIVLDDRLLAPIWKSSPKAHDAWRLARIIALADPPDAANIADEYGNWRTWINEQFPATLDARTLMWSCAFCDGGYRKSVMQMAEALRRRLGEKRSALDILSDRPSAARLTLGKIRSDAERAHLSPDQHGLAAAIRRHLWEEYEGQQDIFREWLVSQVKELPPEDADRVVDAVLDLVTQYRDDALLKSLRDALAKDRRALAIAAFSKAALDPRFGAHIRDRFYAWLDSASPDVIGFIAEVCGGPFGRERPDMALVRLRRAAQKSAPGSTALANGFTSFAAQHPRLLLSAIHAWFTQPAQQTAGINALLALASRTPGVQLLFPDSPLERGNPVSRGDLADYLRTAITEQASQETTISVLETWKKFVEEGVLSEDSVIEVAAYAVAPLIQNNIMRRLLPDDLPNRETLWGKVFYAAVAIDVSTRQTENA